jgi:microcystin degradation protein MlrC
MGDFAIRRGEELLQCTGDNSPLGGALASAREFGWEVAPAVDFRANPSATVEDEVVESFWQGLAAGAANPMDAVYLVLHGAMVSESLDDVEGEILARLRRLIGPTTPIFGVYDLHANFTRRMAATANCLVAYRENPHTDARAAAQRAAALLQRTLNSGRIPHMSWRHPPLIWPPTGTGTAHEPMLSLERLARTLEEESPDLWAVNVNAGFSFADTPEAGVCFSVASVGAPTATEVALDRLAAAALEQAEAGNAADRGVDEVFAELQPLPPGLTVLVEPSDNIGAGAPGDSTCLLRALLERRCPNAAVAINDPAAVQRLSSAAVGARLTLPIGGRGSRFDPGPVTLDVELVRFTHEGGFELEDRQSHLASMICGNRFDMGPCAVVRHGGVTLLLTSRRTPPFDLGQWRSQGIDPARLSIIVVKAAVAHRRAYDPIAARMLWVDTPGPCTSNLMSLPFRKIRRPIYPLDRS